MLPDEPSASLGLLGQHELPETVRKLECVAVGILLVTHHLSDIIPEINCVIFIRQGRVVADGPKREILNAAALREPFGVEVQLAERGGYYHLW